ncbi:MAG: RidA family protein [Bacteroidota bacterium]
MRSTGYAGDCKRKETGDLHGFGGRCGLALLTAGLLFLLAGCGGPAWDDEEDASASVNEPTAESMNQAVDLPEGWVDADAKIEELDITLRSIGSSPNTFVSAVQVGDMLYLSGRGPVMPDGGYMTGKLGSDLSVDEGYEAARLTGIDLLAAIKSELGSLNRVERIVKVLGVVNAEPEFERHPEVINGFSDLMVEVFGERGQHARSALGMGSLPFGIPVEIEMIVQVRTDE